MKSLLLLMFCLSTVLSAAGAPRVLILGDSFYQGLAQGTTNELKGRAEVVFAASKPGEVFNSGISSVRLDEMLGSGKWDLIHFNFGHGDLFYKMPGIASVRTLPKTAGGVRMTSPAEYEKNLQAIVTRLKATKAKLVWATSAPIRSTGDDTYDVGSEIEYNAIAAKVMTRERVPTNDMHAQITELIEAEKSKPDGKNPFNYTKQPLHPLVVKAITTHLNLR